MAPFFLGGSAFFFLSLMGTILAISSSSRLSSLGSLSEPDVSPSPSSFPSKLCDYFSFEQSRFSMHKSKEATARMAMWKEIKIPAIYTLEASFSGTDMGTYKD